jgi:CMP/dCMP kinase
LELSLTFVIAIDGPAGAGKSSVARSVAKRLGLSLVDTGAIYRSLALAAQGQGVSEDDEQALVAIAEQIQLSFSWSDDVNQVFLNGNDVTDAIRTPPMSGSASRVSRHPGVRGALLGLQQKLGGTKPGSVLEGRDIGTVVFPNAALKIFLTASAKERAKRRTLELTEKGMSSNFQTVLDEIEKRDKDDQSRAAAPLKQADDAHLVDSSGRSLDDVVETIVALAVKHPDCPQPQI